MKELVIKKCIKCGALCEVLVDCTCPNCGIKCCGEEMVKLEAKETDNLKYEVSDENIIVTMNYENKEDDYIEWIALVTDKKVGKKFLSKDDKIEVIFPYEKGTKLYAYSKEGLWVKDVE